MAWSGRIFVARCGIRIPRRPTRVPAAVAFGLAASLSAGLIAPPTVSASAVADPSHRRLRVHMPVTSDVSSTAAAPYVGVIGDATGTHLVTPLADRLTRRGVGVVGATIHECQASGLGLTYRGRDERRHPRCRRDVRATQREMVARFRPRVVVWADSHTASAIRRDDRVLRPGTAGWRRATLRSWDMTVRRLKGAHVVLVLPTWWPGRSPATPTAFPVGRQRALYREWAERHPETVTVVDLAPALCPGGPPCRGSVRGVAPARDHVHLTREGRRRAAARLMRTAAVLRDLWGVGVGPDSED
jgi:SGNH domain (fused to AT3 domains)